MKTIAVICGGKSPEHEISVRSAKNILAAIRRDRFQVLLIGIDRSGCWRLQEEAGLGRFIAESGPELAIIPGRAEGQLIRLDNQQPIAQPDAAFMIVHGPTGEDGVLQGLLRTIDLPFVGPDVLGSAVSMDKDVAKRLLRQAGVKVAQDIVLHSSTAASWSYEQVKAKLGSPVFVKPANMGSSVGVHKVSRADQFEAAITDAFSYDRKVLIEEMIEGREVECAVLGNERPEATEVGEIVTQEEYSFDAKYENPDTAKLLIPTKVKPEELPRLQAIALKAFRTLECEVMARVDMFLTPEGDIYVNEVNTLPGFTDISMYPQLWVAAGLSYPELIERLIELAVQRHQARKALKTSFRD
ncbi:MAG: D-alanine--D-alanine ligase [Phaeodactylibacter sp.]